MSEQGSGALSVRDASRTDIPEIRVLAERIWRSSYAVMLSPAQIDYMLGWMYDPETIAAEMARGVLWRVAASGDSAVGYLAIAISDADTAELNKLYLLPGLQGRGYGQALLGDAMTIAADRGCKTLKLRVNKGNARALRAYKRAGFVEIGTLVADIGGGFVMDDYILARALVPRRPGAHPSHSAPE